MNIELKVILAVLATYRLTVLVCTDEGPFSVMSRARIFLSPYTSLLSCPHCVGVWAAIALNVLWIYFDTAFMVVVMVFGIAGGQSFMESCLEKKWKIVGDD